MNRLQFIRATGLGFGLIRLTVAVALEFLDSMGPNRDEKPSLLNRYEKTYKHSNDLTIYQPILIDENGQMIDGQHRCRAVVETGKEIFVTVITGIPKGAWKYLDQGPKRGFGDVLSAMGEKNSKLLGPIISLINKYEIKVLNGGEAGLEIDHGLGILAKYPGLKNVAASFAGRKTLLRMMGPSIAGFIRFHTSHYEKEIDLFFNQFETGVGTKTGKEPAIKLRDRLISSHGGAAHIVFKVRLAFVIKAINAHLTDSVIAALRFNTTELIPDLVAQYGASIDATSKTIAAKNKEQQQEIDAALKAE